MKSAFKNLAERLRFHRGILVDSNVLLDIATNDPVWGVWSGNVLAECARTTMLIINPIVYAEVSIGFSTIESLNAALPSGVYRREALPWEAGFLAGKSFLDYKRRGGTRIAPIPDFYIGAHAAVGNLMLLTRDVRRYRTYFPTVALLPP